MLAVTLLAAASTLSVAGPAWATQAAMDEVAAKSITVEAPIRAVTLYRGRAMVSRVAAVPAEEGLFELRFEGLPASIDAESLQAAVSGGARLLDVRFETTVLASDASTNPALREAIRRLEAARRASERLGMEMTAIGNRHAFLEAIRAKTATETAKEVGTKALDPEALARQIAFIDSAQAQLIADRVKLDDLVRTNTDEIRALEAEVQSLGGATKVERTAIVSVGNARAAAAEATLRYLVRDAGWAPRYAVRADLDRQSLAIEYDAEVRQATGEDWNGVALALSTAEPTRRAAPRDVQAAFVDVAPPPPPIGEPGGLEMRKGLGEGGRMRGTTGAPAPAGVPGAPSDDLVFAAAPSIDSFGVAVNEELSRGFADAQASTAGSVVSYEIPRATSVPSDASRARRIRIASIDAAPSFTLVARPLVESSVYIRARAANSSGYQFLPGAASVFVGDDSVGVVTLPEVAAGGEMTFWLGVDPRVSAKRVLVRKESLVEGAFDKSDVTRWDFRVDLASTLPKPVEVELVDRLPVSRNKEIRIELENDLKKGGAALATDAKYLADERPQGILKWIVALPAQSEPGKPATKSVAWGVRVARPKGMSIVGLPE
jgi:hypothetical protein